MNIPGTNQQVQKAHAPTLVYAIGAFVVLLVIYHMMHKHGR